MVAIGGDPRKAAVMSATDRNRLSELCARISRARANVAMWFEHRHSGSCDWFEADPAYCRSRAREAIREARYYQLRAARLRSAVRLLKRTWGGAGKTRPRPLTCYR